MREKIHLHKYTTKIASISLIIGVIFFINTLVSGYSIESTTFALCYGFSSFGCLIFGFGMFFTLMEETTENRKA